MTSINLIPTYRIDACRRRWRLHRWCVVGALYAAAAVLATAAATTVMHGGGRDLSDDIAFTQGKVAGAERVIATLQPQLADLRATLDASRAVTRQPDWSLLLAMLAQLRGEEVFLREVTLRPAIAGAGATPAYAGEGNVLANPIGYSVSIVGLGLSQVDVSRFVLRLEQVEVFDRVVVVTTRREPFNNVDAVYFQLEGLLAGEEADQP